jgi:hypothetical protein
LGLRRLVAAFGFAAVAALIVTGAALVAAAVAAGLGMRWVERRREQGLDDPIAMMQQRARDAKVWFDARRSLADDAPGSEEPL